ncbi:integral membrane protein GPR180 [Lucilia sericata]|uniref:integral membrane protein GPR180 n=1 Tax=Lucilia sericata TaxID=13632 RepID=UPI0018A85C9D|nr:integral membrane protein GPR180 [Lucilia sericata]XP_037813877.1 integral membrane protein GPR180 [Lucilia sericata]
MNLKGSTQLRLLLHLITFLVCYQQYRVAATHLKGSFDTQDFFKFIVKFGFQKAELHRPQDSFGYIYGNVTSQQEFHQPVTLVVLDKSTFVDFYNNRSLSIYARELACQHMFQHVQLLAYDVDCNPHGKRDFLRRIPCPQGKLCVDEDAPNNVIAGNQFTYVISEVSQPRFWYVAMVACYRNRTTCKWHAYDTLTAPASFLNNSISEIHYDIHVVNGHPNNSAAHPLTYEFSFDRQNLLEMYLIFFLVYMILLPMQIYAVRLQKHPVTKLFTLSLLSEFVSLALISAHLIKFAMNGKGLPNVQTSGDILDIFSRTTFMLILLLLAKGWAVTRQQISRTGWIILMSIWVPYCAFHVFLYYWDRTEVDIISDVDEYQTWPGWIVLILRTTFMLWFLYELRNTMKYEHSTKKLDFLLHLGASSLVWFIYLPIVAIVALQVSPMWRYKLLLGITNSADCLAYCVMTGLLWPNRSGQYLLLTGTKYAGMDELDEFNEAPHIVRERERRQNSIDNNIIVVTNSNTTTRPIIPNGDACTDLLEAEDLDAELLTDLNKNSHIVA